jgi:hypothetical protein
MTWPGDYCCHLCCLGIRNACKEGFWITLLLITIPIFWDNRILSFGPKHKDKYIRSIFPCQAFSTSSTRNCTREQHQLRFPKVGAGIFLLLITMSGSILGPTRTHMQLVPTSFILWEQSGQTTKLTVHVSMSESEASAGGEIFWAIIKVNFYLRMKLVHL